MKMMSSILFILIGLVFGFVIGIVREIIGETAFNILLGVGFLVLMYMFFNFFGAFWGIIIIIGLFIFIIGGLIDIGKEAGSSILSFFDK